MTEVLPGFDPLAHLPRGVREMVIAYVGPCPLFLKWARLTCKAWSVWIATPAPPSPWDDKYTLLHLCEREPETVCLRLGQGIIHAMVKTLGFNGLGVVLDLVLTRDNKAILCDMIVMEVLQHPTVASASTREVVLIAAIRMCRADLLRTFRHLVCTFEATQMHKLYWQAVFRSNAETLAALLSIRPMALLHTYFVPTFGEQPQWRPRSPLRDADHLALFRANAEVLLHSGMEKAYFVGWIEHLVSRYNAGSSAECIPYACILCRVASITVYVLCRKLRSPSVANGRKLHEDLVDLCGCQLDKDEEEPDNDMEVVPPRRRPVLTERYRAYHRFRTGIIPFPGQETFRGTRVELFEAAAAALSQKKPRLNADEEEDE